ncbi:MAG: hypothetical protein GY815_03220 [Gammaproteobacteria bacterium]|nr:hypothetical protein [Gammaproteobacteria bacterium]
MLPVSRRQRTQLLRLSEGSAEYLQVVEYYEQQAKGKERFNGALGAKQLAWLDRQLASATREGQGVVVFSHFPVYPVSKYNLWNAAEVRALIDSYDVVKLYVNGHDHKGRYAGRNGVHYLTLKGMVETEQNAFSRLDIQNSSFQVTGYGREETRVLPYSSSIPLGHTP